MHSLLLLFSVLSSLSSLTNSLTIDLVHRDSPFSPFYNSSKAQSDLIQNAALRSISRSRRFHHCGSNNIISNSTTGDYLIRIYVGTPPVETWAIADTGSDLVWLQCFPCKTCYPQNAPFFNPKRSSTYKTLSCRSKPCTLLPEDWSNCGASKECLYVYGYVDDSGSSGELAEDFVHFGGQRLVSFRKTVFGCGQESHGEFPSEGAGLVGLDNGPLSLVSQLGPQISHRFSYCLVPYLSNSTGKLKLGEEARISRSHGVASSPLITIPEVPSHYVLNIEGITIGQKTVKLNESEGGNIVIDSGSTLTHLPTTLYNKVEALVKEAIGMKPVKNPPETFNLCYANHEFGSYIKKSFPSFVFHFKGADISLKPDQNLFVQNVMYHIPSLFCFAVVPINGSIAVYGNVAQTNFQVEFDLQAKTVSFAPSDCANQ